MEKVLFMSLSVLKLTKSLDTPEKREAIRWPAD